MAKRISIKLIKSTIGAGTPCPRNGTLFGIKKINSVVEHEENLAILDMVKSIAHVVEVKELN